MRIAARTRRPNRSSAQLVAAFVAASVIGLAGAGCQNLPHSESVFRDRTDFQGPDKLADAAPVDILIAPVRNQTERDDVPVALLRQALHDALVERLYSPLDIAYTDAHWVESSFRGEGLPDAILVASITHYETSGLMGQGTLEIGVDLRLFRGGSTAGEPLWSAQVDRVLRVVTGGHPPFGPEDELVRRGSEQWGKSALSVLPERDPLTGVETP